MRVVRSLCVLSLVSTSYLSAQSSQVGEADKLFNAQRYSEARQLLTPIGKKDASAAFLLGKIAMAENQAPRAVDWLEKAVELNPRSSEYYDWLGKAYGTQAQKASKLKQPFLANKTKNAWEKAIALDPTNLEAKSDMIQYYLQAPGFLGGDKTKARALAQDIKRQSAYRGAFAVANVCTTLKDQPCIESELKYVVANYADSAAGYSSLSAFYANAKQYDKAFALLDQRLKARPNDAAALYAFGRTASMAGQNLDRAEDAMKAYIAAPLPNGPAVANAHYRLGMIYERKGARDLARREYQIAVQLNPKLDEAKKALAGLK